MTSTPIRSAPFTPRALALSNGWLLLALYFGAQWWCRMLVSPALELDEAEQALWTQQLQWGYGAQPPLYTWLQWGMFQLFGVSVLSLSLLKNLLLAATYACVFLAGRLLMPAGLAALASASMLLLPQIGWESSRDLTHSVLLTAMAAATLYLVLALLERPRPVLYLLLGVAVAMGMLSKYSYALFLLALLAALLTGRDTRAVMRNRWTLIAVLLALLLMAPHAAWLLEHWQEAAQSTMDKLEVDTAPGRAADIGRGLASLGVAVAGFVWPWAIVIGLLFGRALRRHWQPGAMALGRAWNPAALGLRYLLMVALLCVAMVVLGEVTRFKDRWMQPLLFCLPTMMFACAPALGEHPRTRTLRRILFGVGLLVLVLLALRPHYHAWRGKPNQFNLPAEALVQALRANGYAGTGTILTADRTLGGTLRLQFPAARVQVLDALPAALPAGRPLLAIDSLGTTVAPLSTSAVMHGVAAPPPAHELALPYQYASAAMPPARFRYVLIR